MKLLKFICLVLSPFCMVHANVVSVTGTLDFSTINLETIDMSLNHVGLGVGVSPAANLHVAGNAWVETQLSVGTSGSSNLNISGSLGLASQQVSSNIILDQYSLYFADSSSGNLFLDLPYASNVTGRQVAVKKTSSLNNVYIRGGGNFIDNSDWIVLGSDNLGCAQLISDGSKWQQTSYYPGPTSQSNLDIFYEPFSGTGALSGSVEAVSGNSWVTVSSSLPGWSANGICTDADNEFIFLPYHVKSGRYYTLSMDITGSSFSSNWVGIGFARSYNNGTPRSNLSDMGPWMLLRDDRTLNHQTFEGFGTSGNSQTYTTSNTGAINLKVVLDTRLSTTYVSWYVDDVIIKGPSPHLLSDPLTYVGFGKNGTVSANVDNFRLQEWY